MAVPHVVFGVVFASIIVVGGLLTADELVGLRRKKHGSLWRTASTPDARRLRFDLLVLWMGVNGLLLQLGNAAVSGATTSIFVALLVWNVRAARVPRHRARTQRQEAPRSASTCSGGPRLPG